MESIYKESPTEVSMEVHAPWKVVHPSVSYECSDQAIVIIHFEEGCYYSLEHKTYIVWKLLELGLSTFQILAYFDQRLHPEIFDLLTELERDGLINKERGDEPSLAHIQSKIEALLETPVDHSAPLTYTMHDECSFEQLLSCSNEIEEEIPPIL